MARYIYRKRPGANSGHVELQFEEGEALSEQQALLALLDQIDSRIYELQEVIREARASS